MIEFFCALLIVSGPLKGHIQFIGLPVPDITLLSLLVLTVGILFRLINRPKLVVSIEALLVLLILIGLFIWLCLSTFYTSSEYLYLSKATMYLVPLFCFLLPILTEEFDVERFLKFLVVLIIFVCCLFVYYFPQMRLGLLKSTEFNLESMKTIYLGVGGLAAIGIMIVLSRRIAFSYGFLISLFLSGVLFISGARAPLVFLILVVFGVGGIKFLGSISRLSLGKRNFIFTLQLIVILIPLILAVLYFQKDFPDSTKIFEMAMDRFLLLFSEDQGVSIATRFSHIDFSLASINSNLLIGEGLASYSKEYHGLDGLDYPHNFFLELAFELGIVIALLVALSFALPFITLYRKKDLLLTGIYVFLLLNSLKSFSIVENRIFFFFLGLSLSYHSILKDDKPARS